MELVRLGLLTNRTISIHLDRKLRRKRLEFHPYAIFAGLLMGHFRQSKRRASSFLSDLLNFPCSPAWTVKIQNLVSDALSEPYCQLQTELTKQSQLYVDESSITHPPIRDLN